MYKVIELSDYYEDSMTDVNVRLSKDDVTLTLGSNERSLTWEEFEEYRKLLAKASKEHQNV